MGLMVEYVAPGAKYDHLSCLYSADEPCPARHRQQNKLHATEKLLCEEHTNPMVASCDCKHVPISAATAPGIPPKVPPRPGPRDQAA